MTNYDFYDIAAGMPDVDVKTLLNPTGSEIQDALKGSRNAGRVAVAAYWNEIDKALQSGVPVAAIYQVLHKAGLVSVTRQAFTRQVKARREVARASRSVAKSAPRPEGGPAEEPQPASLSSSPTSDIQGTADTPSGPRRPWRTGQREAPDPEAFFTPRDPLAND
jgi:hypothetical protein